MGTGLIGGNTGIGATYDFQFFSGADTYTWSRPVGSFRRAYIVLWAAGGGGGNGFATAATTNAGGGGGGGGQMVGLDLPWFAVPSTITLTVGSGGVANTAGGATTATLYGAALVQALGGAAGANGASGVAGVGAGIVSYPFTPYRMYQFGTQGQDGKTGGGVPTGTSGRASSATPIQENSFWQGAGGGGGSSASASSTTNAGGQGGPGPFNTSPGGNFTTTLFGTGQPVSGGPGGAGSSVFPYCAGGGGAGGGILSGVGQNGGAGGFSAGGGGGAGGWTTAGAGGAGGDGMAMIFCLR